MSTIDDIETRDLLQARVRLASGVVYRSFVNETVILDTETGRCRSVSSARGALLDALSRTGGGAAALRVLALNGDRAPGEIEAELRAFCRDLIADGLLIVESP